MAAALKSVYPMGGRGTVRPVCTGHWCMAAISNLLLLALVVLILNDLCLKQPPVYSGQRNAAPMATTINMFHSMPVHMAPTVTGRQVGSLGVFQ